MAEPDQDPEITRPAPLVAPTSRRHWYIPLAAAAVIALSLVVTLNMQWEQPDVDGTISAPGPEEPAAKRAEEAETPERMLERIARLRGEGRHKEADDLYAEFRHRYPGYLIPERMHEQVRPR